MNEQDGLIILSMSEARAHEIAEYAKVNPKFCSWLEKALDGSVLGSLIIGQLTLVFFLAVNHGFNPAKLLVRHAQEDTTPE